MVILGELSLLEKKERHIKYIPCYPLHQVYGYTILDNRLMDKVMDKQLLLQARFYKKHSVELQPFMNLNEG